MSTSRAELAYADILAEYQIITTANGYRTDPFITNIIRDSKNMPNLSEGKPEIGIEYGTSEVEIEGYTEDGVGDNDVVVNEFIPVYIVGTIRADMDADGTGTKLKAALDELLHDLKVVTIRLISKHINDTTGAMKWNVVTAGGSPRVKFDQALGLGKNASIAKCGTTFTVKIRNEASDFVG